MQQRHVQSQRANILLARPIISIQSRSSYRRRVSIFFSKHRETALKRSVENAAGRKEEKKQAEWNTQQHRQQQQQQMSSDVLRQGQGGGSASSISSSLAASTSGKGCLQGQRPLAFSLALGQLLSICIAGTGVFSEMLARKGVNVPTAQSTLNYLLLSLAYGPPLLARLRRHRRHRGYVSGGEETIGNAGSVSNGSGAGVTVDGAGGAVASGCGGLLSVGWRTYLLLALLDVEGNYLLVKAYQYTSLTSVTLLDCATIPAVVLLSSLLLRARYRAGHYAGAALCMLGVAVLVASDGGGGGGPGSYPNPLLGDAYVLAGASLYAASNVAQERLLVSDTRPYELLAMVGGLGFLISTVQALLVDWHGLAAVPWGDADVLAAFAGFAAVMFAFYSLVPLMLLWGGAAMLNLSLLSADLWSAAARCVLFDGFTPQGAAYFGAATAITAAGLLLYTRSGEVRPPPSGQQLGVGVGGADNDWHPAPRVLPTASGVGSAEEGGEQQQEQWRGALQLMTERMEEWSRVWGAPGAPDAPPSSSPRSAGGSGIVSRLLGWIPGFGGGRATIGSSSGSGSSSGMRSPFGRRQGGRFRYSALEALEEEFDDEETGADACTRCDGGGSGGGGGGGGDGEVGPPLGPRRGGGGSTGKG